MKRVSDGGFTIVESMIVLGVTGVLFVSLLGLVTGQQAKASFKSAMADITTQLQSQLNEVSTGYYPNNGTFLCDRSGNSLRIQTVDQARGTNSDCTFLGRAIMYAIPGTDPEQYKIHTLVGLRTNQFGEEPTTTQAAGARALGRGANYGTTWPTGLSSTKTLQFGTTVAYMRSLNGGGPGAEPIAGIAVVVAPNQQVLLDLNGSVESGTVIPSIIPIPYSSASVDEPGAAEPTGIDLIAQALGLPDTDANYIDAKSSDGPIEICFKSGTSNQSGLVVIGRNDSTTSIEFEIFNTPDCT